MIAENNNNNNNKSTGGHRSSNNNDKKDIHDKHDVENNDNIIVYVNNNNNTNNRILSISEDLLQNALSFLNSYELIQISLTNKILNKFIAGNKIIWSNIGRYDFDDIAVVISKNNNSNKNGMKTNNDDSKNRYDNDNEEIKLDEILFLTRGTNDVIINTGKDKNSASNQQTTATTSTTSFQMTKSQYRKKYISRLKMLKQDFHLRHIAKLENIAKEKQEYWRAPILWVTSFCTLVCPFFLSGLFILFLIEKLDEPHRTHHTWFTVFLPMWLGFLIVGIGMCSAIKASKHRLDNNNNDNNNNNNRAREHERQQRQQQERARENERRQQNPNQRIQQRIGQDGLRLSEEEEWNPRPNNNINRPATGNTSLPPPILSSQPNGSTLPPHPRSFVAPQGNNNNNNNINNATTQAGEDDDGEDEEEYIIEEDLNDYSLWATQWPTVKVSLPGFIVHELLNHNPIAIRHCTILSIFIVLFPTLMYFKVQFNIVDMPWSITFIPIWLFFSGFLCAPCFQWVFKEKKAHMLFFLIVCFIWIPTVISSILLAYKLDHDDKDAMKLRYVFVPFWVLDSIICFLYIIFTIYAIYKESKSNQNADNYQDVVRPTICSTALFSILFIPLLVFTIQFCQKEEETVTGRYNGRGRPFTYGAVFAPLILWLAFVLLVIFIVGIATAKENERLHEFRERVRIEDDFGNGERGIRDGNGRVLRA